ncbi:unnamed protein product [Aureobasidium pullulans]|nr:unnamed protein product [Aureobasidium pullulans]
MAQINRAAVVTYTHLSEDEQLAYLSEVGNVAPVVLGLRKAYNDKVDRNQMLLDEIKTLTDSFDQAKARTLAHEQANDAIPDREEAERVQRLYHDTLTQLKTRCADELGLESPTVQVPFKFIPAASSNRQDDLSEARKHKESLEEELEVQKEAERIAVEKLILLESTSSGTTQELTEAKQQLNRSEEEVTKLKEEKAAAEKEKAESDEAVGVLQAEKDQLVKDKEEMQQKWEQELQNELEEVQKESEDHMDEADALRVKLENSTNEWSRTLMEESSEYLFAEQYINPNAAPKPTPEDVTTVDLIRWSKNLAVPPGLTSNDLDQIVWLETHLLESIRKRQRQGSPVLLAFQILLDKINSNDWLARCISCVRLAVLGGQYVMKDVEAWDRLVGDPRSDYPQLDVDPLAQACIAKLALTTINKTSHMCQALAEAYDQGGFTKNTLIPSIVTLLHDDGVRGRIPGDQRKTKDLLKIALTGHDA